MNPQSRRRLLWLLCCGLISSAILSCASTNPTRTPAVAQVANTQIEKAPVNGTPVIHVFVALADNINQGIVPVSATLGNGDNAATNLYWGAAFGIKTFFSRSKDWELVSVTPNPSATILERCIFKHRRAALHMIADAYRGKEISQATTDFLEATAGKPGEKLNAGSAEFHTGGSADLVAYIGHNGLMDFKLNSHPQRREIANDERSSSPARASCTFLRRFAKAALRPCFGPRT